MVLEHISRGKGGGDGWRVRAEKTALGEKLGNRQWSDKLMKKQQIIGKTRQRNDSRTEEKDLQIFQIPP